MNTLQNFKISLLEVLTPSQKRSVSRWEKGDNSFSDHVFKDSPDPDRKQFELSDPAKSEHENKIRDHLSKHGIQVNDYKAGNAIDKYGRTVSIGRSLEKTKAPDDLKRGFQNDPARAQKEKSNLVVNLSRHPHDVAGMTSEGHSWENESCMNFSDGSNKDYLKEDVKHGTHVAYLSDRADKKNTKPLARIALKKYTNTEDPHDHILRPEHRTYGNAPDKFSHTVNRIVNDHFPGKEDGIYKKHDDVYDDTGNKYVFGKKGIDKALNHHDYTLRSAAAESPHATPDHVDKALDDDEHLVRLSAISNQNASSKNLHKGLEHKDIAVRMGAAQHPNAKEEHIEKALKDSHERVRHSAMRNPNLSKKHIDDAQNSEDVNMRRLAIYHPKATSEHFDKAMEDHPSVREVAAMSNNIPDKHIDKAISDNIPYVRERISQNDNLKPHHIHKLLDDPVYAHRLHAIQRPNASKENIHKALDDSESFVRLAALSHENATSEHIHKALDDSEAMIQSSAVRHEKATKENLEKALKSPTWHVRDEAAERLGNKDFKK